MTNQITLYGPTKYNTSYPPKDARKGYVAKITGRAPGAVKYEREFLGESVTLVEGDTGLYERQVGEKKGGFTRFYHVVLEHPEHGLISSVDCEDEVPKIAKALDEGIPIEAAVEVTNLRPHSTDEGRMVFDAVARTLAQARKEAKASTTEEAIQACRAALSGLDPADQKKVLTALRKEIS